VTADQQRDKERGQRITDKMLQTVIARGPNAVREITDTQLLVALCHRVETAVQVLYLRHYQAFYRVARRVLDHHEDAEEIANDTFVSIFRSACQFDPQRGNAVAWMMTICRHAALRKLNSRKAKQGQDFAMNEALLEYPGSMEEPVRADLFSRAFECAGLRLSPDDIDELKIGRGPGAGRTTWHVAIEKLKRAFRDCWKHLGGIEEDFIGR
jgi:RNA polymerase sigma factor (sigma-70 family)